MEDTTIPMIDYTGPVELTFEVGSISNELVITVTDLFPNTYTLYQDRINVSTDY